jgi:hypothetical protein
VNGQRIREVVLGAGDQIGMGDSVLVLGSSPVELKDPGASGDAGAAVS